MQNATVLPGARLPLVVATLPLSRKKRWSVILFTKRDGVARRLAIGLIFPRLTGLIDLRESAA